MKTKLLSIIALLFQKNRDTPERMKYPQLWYCMPQNKYIKISLQFLCKIFGGHELSKTEWGYNGGEYADCWCRWCNRLVQVSKTSLYFTHPQSKDMMKDIGKEIKKV